MRKVCVVITARPSYSRIKTVLQAIKSDPDLQLQLIVAASALLERYGEVVNVIRADGFQPDAIVYMVLEGENLIQRADQQSAVRPAESRHRMGRRHARAHP